MYACQCWWQLNSSLKRRARRQSQVQISVLQRQAVWSSDTEAGSRRAQPHPEGLFQEHLESLTRPLTPTAQHMGSARMHVELEASGAAVMLSVWRRVEAGRKGMGDGLH